MNDQVYEGLVIKHNKNKKNLIVSVVGCIGSRGLVHLFDFLSKVLSNKTAGEFTSIDNATGGEFILSLLLLLLTLLFTIVAFIAFISIIVNVFEFLKSSSNLSKYKSQTQ